MSSTALENPEPQSPKELEILVGIVNDIRDFPQMSPSEQDFLLRRLEAYECYSQAARLIAWRIQGNRSDTQDFADFLWLMRIEYLGLERFTDFTETAKWCIAQLGLSFSTIRIHIAEDILGVESFLEQAAFYCEIESSISSQAQRVLLLERLALIYEKKLFRENDVEPVFQKILDLDGRNVKALKFYKLWYMQAARWREAATQLEGLLEAAQNPNERQRVAHELAQLYLYNLNQPEQARDILIEHCAHSQLDTRQTLMEALERLEAYDELLDCLREAERLSRDSAEQAGIKLKTGLVSIKAGRHDEAVAALKASIKLNSKSLLAYEALLSALIDARDSDQIIDLVKQLETVVTLESSRATLAKFFGKLDVWQEQGLI